MSSKNHVRGLLEAKYRELLKANPKFSMRAFAKKLGTSSGALSEVLSGKRALSEKKLRELLTMKLFDPSERNELARAGGFVLALGGEKRRPVYSKISAQQTQVIADWWHFAILSLMKTRGFKSDVQWVSRRLGLDRQVAEEAIFRLKELGLIREEKGHWVRTNEAVSTPDDRVDLAVQKGNQGLIRLASARLSSIPPELRDVTSYVMAIHPNRLPAAKQAIRRLQDELSSILERDDATEVYQLGIQLFPISRADHPN